MPAIEKLVTAATKKNFVFHTVKVSSSFMQYAARKKMANYDWGLKTFDRIAEFGRGQCVRVRFQFENTWRGGSREAISRSSHLPLCPARRTSSNEH